MFSDDQIAILACVGAIVLCGLLMSLSFHFGPANHQETGERASLSLKPGRKSGTSAAHDRRAA